MSKYNYKNLDLEKIKGRYVHFGHIIEDIQQNASKTIDGLFAEIYQSIEGLMLDQIDKKEDFDTAKKILLDYFVLITAAFEEITPEVLREKYTHIMKANKENWEELKNLFGKNGQNYFS